MELETVGLVLAFVVAVFITAVVAYGRGIEHERRKPVPVVEPVLPAQLYDELADLRHIKAQLERPPLQHDHIWPREPDLRKMGWLRYRCAYGGCVAIRWVQS